MSPLEDEFIKVCYINKMQYFTDMRKKEILSFVTTWMELQDIMLTVTRQIEKEKYSMIYCVSKQ